MIDNTEFMARPRKPTAILEANGAYEAHPERRRGPEPLPPEGELIVPRSIRTERELEIWNDFATICYGMGTAKRGDERELATWVLLEAQFEESPKEFTAAKLAQKRALAERFGLCGAGSRAKLAAPNAKETKDRADTYFEQSRPDTNLRQ